MDDIPEDDIPDDQDRIYLRHLAKLVKLSPDRKSWYDVGVGQVSINRAGKGCDSFLIIRDEEQETYVLNMKVKRDTPFVKHPGKFISWGEDGQVYGISFNSSYCCRVIWHHITEIQSNNPYGEGLPKTEVKEDSIKKEEIKTEIKQEVKNEIEDVKAEVVDEVTREMWYEEMLDIEHQVLPRCERDILDQLIEIFNKMVLTAEDKSPSPAEKRLLDLFHITEDIEVTARLEQLHITILSLLDKK